jgi:glycosyltransferase involved in cell wall biosynthesis
MNQTDSTRATPFVGTDATRGRRLLLISYHFAPSAEVGAVRWLKFARHLCAAGWAIDVISVDPANVHRKDERLLTELPPQVRVFSVPIPRLSIELAENAAWKVYRSIRERAATSRDESQGARTQTTARVPAAAKDSLGRAEISLSLLSIRDWRRAYYAWLEYRRDRAWGRGVARLGTAIVRQSGAQLVISCGPPHMAHEAARQIAVKNRLPFAIDMRDPWSLVERLPEAFASPVWLYCAHRAERRVVAQAGLVVTNTEPFRRGMMALYPNERAKFVTIMNGFDDDVLPAPRARSRFVIAYAGTIYLDRDPSPLLEAVARVTRKLGLSPAQLGIEFVGRVESYDGVAIETIAQDLGVAPYLQLLPPRPRHEVFQFLSDASVLVSLPQDSELAIPSKVFEYMRFDAWILALTTQRSATAAILEGKDADIVSPSDTEGIANALEHRYQLFADGKRGRPLADDRRLSREAQATELLVELNRLAK